VVRDSQRSPEQIREQYEVEKALAARLRGGTPDERKQLYGKRYDKMYLRLPSAGQVRRVAAGLAQ
jgi:hypothetical protein